MRTSNEFYSRNMEWKDHATYKKMEQRPNNTSRRFFWPSIGLLRFDLDFGPKWPARHHSSRSSLGCWIRLDCSEQVPDGYADRRGLLFNLVNGHRITQTLFVENTLKAGRENFTRLHHLPRYMLIEGKNIKKENTCNPKNMRRPFFLGLPTTCPEILLL